MTEHQIENIILNYLNKNYCVVDNLFLNRYKEQEWGNVIISSLPVILNFTLEKCSDVFDAWALGYGVDKDTHTEAYGPIRLKATWSPELAFDLQMLHGIDAEAELTRMLSQQIADEIDSQILKDLRDKINVDNLFNIIKCVGYEATSTIYDPNTFAPRRYFQSIKKQEIEHERQNNPYWQDWIKNRPS